MIDIDKLNLESAETTYMVANTPMFIVRKLKADPVVLELSQDYDADAIAEQIRNEISKPPEDIRQRVLPFVLLVALSLKNDRRRLIEISRLDVTAYRWFDMVLNALIETVKSTTSLRVEPTVSLLRTAGHVHAKSSANTSAQRVVI